MNREIEFRGKRTDNKEWFFGDFAHQFMHGKNRVYIAEYDDKFFKEVDPETVGQYINLKDQADEKIYHKDIITIEWEPNEKRKYVVEFKDGAFGYYSVFGDFHPFADSNYINIVDGKCLNIQKIGNIHDNPELLK